MDIRLVFDTNLFHFKINQLKKNWETILFFFSKKKAKKRKKNQ